MDRTFLGTGWDFLKLVQLPAQGGVAPAREEESVRQAIWIILGTARGERVMRPDFGCGIHELVFSTGGSTLTGQVIREVREALVLWEPRIDVQDVRAAADPADPATLLVEIDYRVRTTNNQFNLVYPFYLERTAS
jgi:phage baseplate assembly protein W